MGVEQVEAEMSQFGAVAGCSKDYVQVRGTPHAPAALARSCSKDYVEVRGCRIENERRNVLFTALQDELMTSHW